MIKKVEMLKGSILEGGEGKRVNYGFPGEKSFWSCGENFIIRVVYIQFYFVFIIYYKDRKVPTENMLFILIYTIMRRDRGFNSL